MNEIQIVTARSLGEKIVQERVRRLQTIPLSCRGLFERVYGLNPLKKATPRQRVKAQCLECMGFDRAAIAGCPCFACSLWEIRPFRAKTKTGLPL